jgi:hypothetical protein
MLLPWQNFLLLHMRNVGLSQLQLTGKKLKVHECKCRPIWFSLPHIIFSWIFLRSKAKNNSMETSGIKLSILSGALYVGFDYLFHGVHDYLLVSLKYLECHLLSILWTNQKSGILPLVINQSSWETHILCFWWLAN